MSEFRLVEIGIISLRDALSSGHIPIMNAFIRDQGGEVRVLECVLWKADSEGRGGAVGGGGGVRSHVFVYMYLFDLALSVSVWLSSGRLYLATSNRFNQRITKTHTNTRLFSVSLRLSLFEL